MKRIFDLITTFFGLFLLLPVIIITTLILIRKLGSPIFFIQSRPGLNKKIFNIYKFRTMTRERDIDGALLPDEVRLTKFGKLLRSTSLDELPSLWNVLKGDMSLVGPRPLLVEYLSLYSTKQARRHEVKPGITGWAQVKVGYTDDIAGAQIKVAYDLYYIQNASLQLELKIALHTFYVILTGFGSK